MVSKTEKSDPVKQWAQKNMSIVLKLTERVITDVFNATPRYEQIDFERDIATLRRRTASEGLKFISSVMPSIMTEFLLYLETGNSIYSNVAVKRGTVYPTFLNGLFCLTTDEECNVNAFKSLYQILVGFKKLKGPYSQKVLNDSEDKFVATDASLIHDENHFDDLIIETAAGFVSEVFKDTDSLDYVEKHFRPRPGPGATNTPLHTLERYSPKNLRSPELEAMMCEWFYVNYTYLHDHVSHSNITSLWKRGYDECKSRFKFVHKTLGKPRGICIEENEMQFMQQGLKALMYKLIENHPLTKGKVNFASQDVNRTLALESSASRKYCTIDMSDASDRISRDLVFKIFKYNPNMLHLLNNLSTRIITMPSGDINCNKFSPMGSGICFPIMSIVHWSLIRAILYLSLLPDYHMDDFYVYGDDLIIPQDTYEAVTTLLERFGMKLNINKSFSKSFFRESCGMDAFNGVKVTPVYFKYIPSVHPTVAALESLIAIESQLYKDYPLTAEFIRSNTKVTGMTPIGSPPLTWKRHDIVNISMAKKKWCEDTLTWVYRLPCIVSANEDDKTMSIDGHDAYLRWHIQKCRDHDDQWAHKINKIYWVWLPMNAVLAIKSDFLKQDLRENLALRPTCNINR